jgi:hypothetical protein
VDRHQAARFSGQIDARHSAAIDAADADPAPSSSPATVWTCVVR